MCASQIGIRDGSSAQRAGGTCREIKLRYTNKRSGKYWIQPSKEDPPFQVYCDMSFAGGGWTLGMMYGSYLSRDGCSSTPLGCKYGLYVPNVGLGMEQMASWGDNFGRYWRSTSFSVGSKNYNNIWSFYGHTRGSVIRQKAQGSYRNRRTCETWLYQRFNAPKGWNAFMANFDAKLWNNYHHDDRSHRVIAYGIPPAGEKGQTGLPVLQFIIAWSGDKRYWYSNKRGCSESYTSEFYDKRSGQLVAGFNPRINGKGRWGGWYDGARYEWQRMHYWETRYVYTQSGEKVGVGRHGIPGDPWDGCSWVGSFGNGRSQSWCDYNILTAFFIK